MLLLQILFVIACGYLFYFFASTGMGQATLIQEYAYKCPEQFKTKQLRADTVIMVNALVYSLVPAMATLITFTSDPETKTQLHHYFNNIFIVTGATCLVSTLFCRNEFVKIKADIAKQWRTEKNYSPTHDDEVRLYRSAHEATRVHYWWFLDVVVWLITYFYL